MPEPRKPRALVLDHEGLVATYAILWALRQSCELVAVSRPPGPPSGLALSPLLDRSYELPPIPFQVPADPRAGLGEGVEAWAARLVAVCARERIDTLVPTTDLHVLALALHREELRESGVVSCPIPDVDDAIRSVDKLAMVEAAERVGLPAPISRAVASRAQAEAFARELGYPIVLKARFSTGYEGTRIVRSPGELGAAAEALAAWPGGSVAQEYVPGGSEPSVHMILSGRGEPLLVWTMRKFRYAHRSVSVAFETTERLPETEAAIDFVRDLSLAGASAIQLKEDARTGENKLIEISPRYGGNIRMFIPLAWKRGIDVVTLAARAEADDVAPLGDYPAGDVGVSPLHEPLVVEAFVRAKLAELLDGPGQTDNPPPSTAAFARSFLETYLHRPLGVDPMAAAVLRDPGARARALEGFHGVRRGRTEVPWGAGATTRRSRGPA